MMRLFVGTPLQESVASPWGNNPEMPLEMAQAQKRFKGRRRRGKKEEENRNPSDK